MADLLVLAWIFFKIGLVSWGGGIVIVPMLEEEVVFNHGWLTQREFVDAVTLGQVSPGPVVISATFIGYKACGIIGAFVATISVILPSFILICLATQAVQFFRENLYVNGFFQGARAAVIGMIFEAAMSIGRTSIIDMRTGMIAVFSLAVLCQFKINPIWVLLAAIGVGIVS